MDEHFTSFHQIRFALPPVSAGSCSADHHSTHHSARIDGATRGSVVALALYGTVRCEICDDSMICEDHGEAGRLPPSGYTGGVDDIVASSCPRCEEWRQEVGRKGRSKEE